MKLFVSLLVALCIVCTFMGSEARLGGRRLSTRRALGTPKRSFSERKPLSAAGGYNVDEEEDHTVGGWGQRAACIGAACMMTFNKGAMPPKSYSGYNNPTTPIHRPF